MALSWAFTESPTYVTVTRIIDGITNIFRCNKQLIYLSFTEPEMFFLYSRPDALKYHVFVVNYNLVAYPVGTASASDLTTQIQAMIDNVGNMVVFEIGHLDFTGSNYTDARLIGLTPVTNFSVYTNEGSGTLQRKVADYTFDPVTGTLTMPSGNYLIQIY